MLSGKVQKRENFFTQRNYSSFVPVPSGSEMHETKESFGTGAGQMVLAPADSYMAAAFAMKS